MVDRYFDAIRRDDFEAAMDERCPDARVDSDNSHLFVEQSQTLLEMGGFTSVEVAEPSQPTVDPMQRADESIAFDYRMIGPGGPSEALHGVAILYNGQPKWCGYAQTPVETVTAGRGVSPSATADPSTAMKALMPEHGPTGYSEVDDRPSTEAATEPRWIASWTRAWQDPVYGGARATARRFETSALAEESLRRENLDVARDVTETFAVPGLSNAVGVRYAGTAWTWLQPPDVGYQCDAVFMLAGDATIEVRSCGLGPSEPHDEVIELVKAIDW